MSMLVDERPAVRNGCERSVVPTELRNMETTPNFMQIGSGRHGSYVTLNSCVHKNAVGSAPLRSFEPIEQRAREALVSGQDIVTARIIETRGSVPRHRGTSMLLVEDGSKFGTVGGGRIESLIERICRDTFRERESWHVYDVGVSSHINGQRDNSGGSVKILVRYYSKERPFEYDEMPLPVTTAYIFGCGHVGSALEPVLRSIGFDIVMVDDRESMVSRDKFPFATQVWKVPTLEHGLDMVELNEFSYVFLMGYKQEKNLGLLRAALKKPHAYIGLLGSRRKVASIFRMLEEEGIDVSTDKTVHAPIGDYIKAETPAEIAISIASEVIRVRAELLQNGCSH